LRPNKLIAAHLLGTAKFKLVALHFKKLLLRNIDLTT
jgi:hypothetical protein